jgi:hypothetical protein
MKLRKEKKKKKMKKKMRKTLMKKEEIMMALEKNMSLKISLSV